MKWLETVAVAFAMFSAIPVPQPVWNKQNMRYVMCAFPLIGAVIAACWCAVAWVCVQLGVSDVLRAALLCAVPVVLTGGIHLDGYADVADARASHAPMERKHEILKDPNCGAFALIRTAVYLLVYAGFCAEWRADWYGYCGAAASFFLSRCLSGWAVAGFPLAKNTGLAHTFAQSSDRTTVRIILTVLFTAVSAALAVFFGVRGLFAVAAALLVFARYYVVAKKEFGGITGDLAGWFLQRSELAMLAAVVLGQLGRNLQWF